MPPSAASAVWRFNWRWLTGPQVVEDGDLVEACVALYGDHYGVWGASDKRAGGRVRITRKRFLDQFEYSGSSLIASYEGDRLVGYAVIVRVDEPEKLKVAWVAQLVVAASYRRSGVATNLLWAAWQFSDYDAWGIVTASPYAIRALETATRRPCRSARVVSSAGLEVLAVISEILPYVPSELVERSGAKTPVLDTNFPIDISDMAAMRKGAGRRDRPWDLGEIEEGTEWFAVTFRDQEPTVARAEYLDRLLSNVDEIWMRAYEGMVLDAAHGWHGHEVEEVEWILPRLGDEVRAVLDAGCGDGRHVRYLAERFERAVGVDVTPGLIDRARETGGGEYHIRDLRSSLTDLGTFDAVICLYDVLGSSADAGDDARLITNLRGVLREGGRLVLGVMSRVGIDGALPAEHLPADDREFVRSLEQLEPSRTMESTGDIFNPRYIVRYEERYYRKEQFDQVARMPPAELIVRDRRFDASTITAQLAAHGFEVEEVHGVRAGRWNTPAHPDDPGAKEILIVARAV